MSELNTSNGNLIFNVLEVVIEDDVKEKLELQIPEIKIIEVCQQGPPGPPGDASAEIDYIAGATLSGHRAVVTNAYNTVIYADNTISWHKNSYVGITTQAANSGSGVKVKVNGELQSNTWNWVVNQPIYFSTIGTLTQTAPTTGEFIKIIAVANSPTSILLTNRESITLV